MGKKYDNKPSSWRNRKYGFVEMVVKYGGQPIDVDKMIGNKPLDTTEPSTTNAAPSAASSEAKEVLAHTQVAAVAPTAETVAASAPQQIKIPPAIPRLVEIQAQSGNHKGFG